MTGRARRAYTTESVARAVPALLEERGESLRGLARSVGVDVAHLSRLIGGRSGKTASGELAVKVAEALDLPADYFPEARELSVIDAVKADAALRDRFYDELQGRRPS